MAEYLERWKKMHKMHAKNKKWSYKDGTHYIYLKKMYFRKNKIFIFINLQPYLLSKILHILLFKYRSSIVRQPL